MSLIFPSAVMVNTFAMTVLMILFGLSGKADIAADVGIVHGATLALFFAFSANARSLILRSSSSIQASSIMLARLALLLPLACISYFLSISAGVAESLVIVLVVRRCGEWLTEVHLSEKERLGHNLESKIFLISQVMLLVIATAWLWLSMPAPLSGLWVWALSPFVASARTILRSFSGAPPWAGLSLNLVPHFGSSAIIGITVYIFRLLVLYITSKEIAGDLFTAFAIGGLAGSVFANAFGASLAVHENRSGKRHMPRLLTLSLWGCLVIGFVLYFASLAQLPLLEISGKSFFFWGAVGLSLLGGVIMVHAQRIRFRILHDNEEQDVFGPDVIINVLLLAAVPFAYYLLGINSLAALYLMSAVMAYLFYSSARSEGILNLSRPIRSNLIVILPIALLFPIFFQASSGVFQNPKVYFDSGGKLLNLPIPFSVLACYMGILLLGDYKRSLTSYMTVLLSCILMLLATLVAALGAPVAQEGKFILLLQFILPMFALALGQVYAGETSVNQHSNPSLPKAFLYVLSIIVPLQLVASWLQGFPFLVPSIWVLSIYQQLQYVPVVFVGAFLISLYSLWDQRELRPALSLFTLLMAIYAAASISMLALGFFMIGLIGIAALRWRLGREKLPVVVLLLAAILAWGYLQYNKERIAFKYSFLKETASKQVIGEGRKPPEILPPNLSKRIEYWQYYLTEISAKPNVLLWGQEAPSDRTKYPSAHNYYIDFVYNFGLVALLPILTLIALTCVKIIKHRHRIYNAPGLAGLSLVVLFLLLVDNSLKVGLRQPYPGIFTFFLWGVLLGYLYSLDKKHCEIKSSAG